MKRLISHKRLARLSALGAAVRPFLPELLFATCIVIAWACLTLGIARIAPARVVWPLSTGVLCLVLGGGGPLRDLALLGLYGILVNPKSSDITAARRQRKAPGKAA